ncbi:hypothetical protein [Aquimarina sp. I32.4]|uniref:hypothetical protein n=1 Tax=Aquimarina sp. I32.4 TaxID=2053903 RepID=UPI000CDEEAE3|nr:hypothetical protein [Aquimarina sp. I32.4]
MKDEIKEGKFSIGDVVTLKTHPMFKAKRIQGDNRYVPPVMIVIAVYPEKRDDILTYKYDCVYFNDDKSEFICSILSQSDIDGFENLLFERINKDGTSIESYTSLIEEVKAHTFPSFESGKIVSFRTKKIEIYKKRTSKKITIHPKNSSLIIEETLRYVVSFATPNFVLCGIKTSYPKGLLNRKINQDSITSNELFKIKWFNPTKNKFSEQYLPKECLVDEIEFN